MSRDSEHSDLVSRVEAEWRARHVVADIVTLTMTIQNTRSLSKLLVSSYSLIAQMYASTSE